MLFSFFFCELFLILILIILNIDQHGVSMPLSTPQMLQPRVRMGLRVPLPDGTFRQPLPPNVRGRMNLPQQVWTAQTQPAMRPHQDPQLRMMVLQQHQQQQIQNQIRFPSPNVPGGVGVNPLDPYDHLVKQRPPLMQHQQVQGINFKINMSMNIYF